MMNLDDAVAELQDRFFREVYKLSLTFYHRAVAEELERDLGSKHVKNVQSNRVVVTARPKTPSKTRSRPAIPDQIIALLSKGKKSSQELWDHMSSVRKLSKPTLRKALSKLKIAKEIKKLGTGKKAKWANRA